MIFMHNVMMYDSGILPKENVFPFLEDTVEEFEACVFFQFKTKCILCIKNYKPGYCYTFISSIDCISS